MKSKTKKNNTTFQNYWIIYKKFSSLQNLSIPFEILQDSFKKYFKKAIEISEKEKFNNKGNIEPKLIYIKTQRD